MGQWRQWGHWWQGLKGGEGSFIYLKTSLFFSETKSCFYLYFSPPMPRVITFALRKGSSNSGNDYNQRQIITLIGARYVI